MIYTSNGGQRGIQCIREMVAINTYNKHLREVYVINQDIEGEIPTLLGFIYIFFFVLLRY